MKPPVTNVHGNNAVRARVTHGPNRPTIQRHGPSSGHVKQNLNQVRAPNYHVQTPIPLGHGSQQIRATIHGTPQVAGSVDIRTAGPRKGFIANLKVEQGHRRRGVAAQLIDAAVATARRQGLSSVSLEARPSDNGISPQALVAMYRRQGFKNVGRTHRGSPLMERKL